MLETEFSGVETQTRGRSATVDRIAQNRKAMFGGMDANLVRAACQWLGFDPGEPCVAGQRFNFAKACFGQVAFFFAANVFLVDADKHRPRGELLKRNSPV